MKITVQVHIGFLQGTVMQRFVGKSLVESFFQMPEICRARRVLS